MVDDLSRRISRYEEFLNERLRSDLQKVLQLKEEVYRDVAEFTQLKAIVELLIKESRKDNKAHKTMVDLGCNFYAKAKIEDCSTIFIAIGLGFHLEMKLEEAVNFIEEKITQLDTKAGRLSEKASQINGRIKMVMEALGELQFPSISEKSDSVREVW